MATNHGSMRRCTWWHRLHSWRQVGDLTSRGTAFMVCTRCGHDGYLMP